MEILLPDQTIVDDIVFWIDDLSDPKKEKTARQEGGAILGWWQAGDIVCGSYG